MKVLVVEDEALISMLLEDMLTDLGHEVIGPAADVREALDLVEHCEVGLLDLNIGNGQTSIPVADALRAAGKPYIFASGAGQGSSSGLWLQKPYDLAQLSTILDQLK